MSFRIEEPGQFRGTVVFLDLKPNDGSIKKEHVEAGAGIEASKLEHQHRAVYAQESATSAADEARTVHVVHGTAGTLLAFKAGSVVANIGDSEIAVDLLVNGVSVLTAVITLDSGDAAYAVVAGVIDDDTLSAGDVIEVSVDGTVGTGTLGKGVFAYVDLEEDYD